jgi:hypothetical protein
MGRQNGSCCGCGSRGDSYLRGGVEKAEGTFYTARVERICGSTSCERPWVTHGNCGRTVSVSRNSALRRGMRGGDGSALAAGGPFTSAISGWHGQSEEGRLRRNARACDGGRRGRMVTAGSCSPRRRRKRGSSSLTKSFELCWRLGDEAGPERVRVEEAGYPQLASRALCASGTRSHGDLLRAGGCGVAAYSQRSRSGGRGRGDGDRDRAEVGPAEGENETTRRFTRQARGASEDRYGTGARRHRGG